MPDAVEKLAGTMPDPSRLMQMSTAYWESQVVLTANRMDLFALLGKSAMQIDDICSALGTAQRNTQLFLNACVSLGLLDHDEAGYSNSRTSREFLVPGGAGYLGNALRYADNLYDTWGKLQQSLLDGEPQMAAETYLGDDDEQTRNFVYGMHDRAIGIARALVPSLDLTGKRQMLDVGGGPGTYSALLAQRFPDLHSKILELPGVAAIAEDIVFEMGVADRVGVISGDYFKTEFPSGNDVVLMSGMFHRETEKNCKMLIEKSTAALDQGGLLIISDVFADAGGMRPPFAALFGLNMMLTAPDGGVHADSDVARWLKDAGFDDVVARPFPPPMPHRIVSGSKK